MSLNHHNETLWLRNPDDNHTFKTKHPQVLYSMFSRPQNQIKLFSRGILAELPNVTYTTVHCNLLSVQFQYC